ncbi:predicted protein [Sclerotinia sclerotiorum 1980 UF-70]|uniref:Uncharacterized protein n=1 Tax=Sclerotinia sclerotiorum (strain ATCC 18683 / 1980 / Ss-1) TaxID=665079 RepID=A7F5Z3_SCLS1|nr:predicted protein [Sclerotinia sclerotiorum 1980 UF-70]EDN98164.1 predicted protein [Sclerotinia sclerotiorum 1980 UF-70]
MWDFLLKTRFWLTKLALPIHSQIRWGTSFAELNLTHKEILRLQNRKASCDLIHGLNQSEWGHFQILQQYFSSKTFLNINSRLHQVREKHPMDMDDAFIDMLSYSGRIDSPLKLQGACHGFAVERGKRSQEA